MRLFVVCLFAAVAVSSRAASSLPEALAIIVGDQHSAYERSAQFLAAIDAVADAHPGVPMMILINGDSLEFGNAVARRTSGAIDFALFAALAARAPTVINLGNHEPEFHDVAETVDRLRATGLKVISGNLHNPATATPYAPAVARVSLGRHEAVIVGITTDRLSTYRVAIRPQLDLADPAVWGREHLPRLLNRAVVPVVLSHSGLKVDRALLSVVPDGTLFAGAHDHLRFVHRDGRSVYFHSGSWLEYMSVARLHQTPAGLQWEVDQMPIHEERAREPGLARLIDATLARELTEQEKTVVARSSQALGPTEAARLAVEAARRAANADVALVGATTFGTGLPAGDVTRFAFDAFVRFDGNLHVAEVDGEWLQRLLARSNQGPDTPFSERTGENLVAAAPAAIDPARRYRLATTDWIARHARDYLGGNPPALREITPAVPLKRAVLDALHE